MPDSLPIQQIHHVSRQTKRLDQSRAFYRDILGFKEIVRPDLGFPGAWLMNYDLQIHLIENSSIDEPTAEISSRANHIAFRVSDMLHSERLLKEHGVIYRVNIQADSGIRQIFFQDPDGHHIELGSDYK